MIYELSKSDIYAIYGEGIMAAAEAADWHGDEYSHPQHGVCAATFYPLPAGGNEIICLWRVGDEIPKAYALLHPPVR